MPLIAYIAVVLVSLSGILFELDWLTKPKTESRPAVHASSVPAPVPRKIVKAEGPSKELNPVYPKKSGPPGAQETAASIASSPEPPASTVASASVETTGRAEVEAEAQPPASPKSTSQAAVETTAMVPTADNVGRDSQPAAESASPPPVLAAKPVAQPVSTAAKNRCDVQGCAGAYKSFRASDCTYQPFQGPRQVCVKPPEGARAAAQPRLYDANRAGRRLVDADRAGRRLSNDDELREVERTVRRITRDEDDFDEPFDYGGRGIFVVRRQGARW